MLQSLDDQIVFAPRWPASPFPGLRPFRITATEDESLIFEGRTRAKDEILARLNSSHLVFVVGPSGCGKSSLLKVGVIPALEAGLLTHAGPNWRTIEMRPGDRPVRNLAYALAALRNDASKSDISGQLYDILCSDESGLWLAAETLAPRAAPNPLLILIDQFEEVFGSQISAQSESKLLLELIVTFWAKAHPNLFLVITMRTDFLEQCANFPKLADAINGTLFMTPVLRDSELKSVISKPPKPYHGMVEPKLVEAIVKDTPSEIGYDPDHLPLMQHALSWLWNNAISAAGLSNSPPRPDAAAPSQTIVLTHDRYVAHGGLKGILNEHADELLAGLSKREQHIAQVVFTRLSERDENRYRRSPTSAAALARLADCGAAELERVVSVFSDPSVCFLDRRPLANGAGELIDVSHESLIRQWKRLRGWVDEEAEKVRRFRELAASAKEWQRHKRSSDFLKRGAELGVWRQWWKSQNPTREWAERYKLDRAAGSLAPEPVDLSKEYLAQSHNRYVLQRVRNWAVGLGVASVLGVIAAAIPVTNIKWEKATLERAKYETAAARGDDLLDNDDPNLALLLALESLRSKEVDGWAIEALAYSALEFVLPKALYDFLLPKEADDRVIEALAYKALQTPQPKAILSTNAQFPTATFSPDGRLLLISKGNVFQVWDADKITPVVEAFNPKEVDARWRAIWSADAQWMTGATVNKGTVLFRPCSVDELRKYFEKCENNKDVIKAIGEGENVALWPSVLSPAGNKLLTGGQGVPPKIWDIESNRFTLLSRSESDPAPQGPVGAAIAFSQRGDLFALGGPDGSVRIHQTADPTKRFILPLPPEDSPSTVTAVAFNPGKGKDDELVSATLDGCVRLWSLKEKKVTKVLNIKNTGFFFVSFDPSGQRIGMTSDDGLVKIWEPGPSAPGGNDASGGCFSNRVEPELLVLRGHRHATWVVEFSRETGLVASASSDSVRIWTLLPPLHPSMLPAAPDRRGAVTVVSRDGALTVRTGKGRDITLDDPDSGKNAAAAAISMDGMRILVAKQKKTLKLYDLSASRVPVARFEVPGVEWKAVGFLSNPDRMVGETTNGQFYAWPFFKDRDALIEFAEENLPIDETRAKIKLTDQDMCRFGIETSRCRASAD
jgi:WD40 repeat protein/energy-coupling factor transporter ATP-binding protein EcfA2